MKLKNICSASFYELYKQYHPKHLICISHWEWSCNTISGCYNNNNINDGYTISDFSVPRWFGQVKMSDMQCRFTHKISNYYSK